MIFEYHYKTIPHKYNQRINLYKNVYILKSTNCGSYNLLKVKVSQYLRAILNQIYKYQIIQEVVKEVITYI